MRNIRVRAIGLASSAVVAMTVAACTRAHPSPQPVGDIAGTWLHREMPVRYREAMTLRVRADSVLGEGTYSMEAGRTGNAAIVGKWRRDSNHVTLDILRDTGVRERWSGFLRGDTLSGTLRIADGDALPFSYVRQP